jgi:hypothetical protein
VADDPILSDGFTDGEEIALDAEYEAALTDSTEAGADEIAFLVRGPEADGAGEIVGLAATDPDLADQKTVILFLPFAGLPGNVQEQLLNNIMAWFGA